MDGEGVEERGEGWRRGGKGDERRKRREAGVILIALMLSAVSCEHPRRLRWPMRGRYFCTNLLRSLSLTLAGRERGGEEEEEGRGGGRQKK